MISPIKTLLAVVNVNPDDVGVPKGQLVNSTIGNGIQLVLGVVGAVALIVIVMAGMQYVLSQGNPQSTAKAKDTILYAIVGLVICMLGYAIVGFVVNNVT